MTSLLHRRDNLKSLKSLILVTRWACCYLAVNLYKSRYGCLVEALEHVIENSSDKTEAAVATGILAQIQKFSFLVLTTFDSILGLTKPLSDALQAKHLNLSAALELANSIVQVMKRSEDYFQNPIWRDSQEMAQNAGVDVILPTAGRRTGLPSRFRDCHVFECTGGRDQTSASIYEAYKAIYYQAVDKVLMELEHRFGEPRPLLQSIATLS